MSVWSTGEKVALGIVVVGTGVLLYTSKKLSGGLQKLPPSGVVGLLPPAAVQGAEVGAGSEAAQLALAGLAL